MINLIPKEAVVYLRREYRSRAITVWSVLMGCAALITAFLLLPTYVLVDSQITAYELEYNKTTDKTSTFSDIADQVRQSNDLAGRLLEETEYTSPRVLTETLEAIASEGIFISSISLKADQQSPINVVGIAETRSRLAAFRSDLESHSWFERVNLPLSDLANERDINFSLQVYRRINSD